MSAMSKGAARMIWETIAALLLVVGTSALWFFVAVIWGLIKAAITFVVLLTALFSQNPIDWSEFWIVPLGAVLAGLETAWGIPSSVWNWGKFEHPVWAAVIGLVCIGAAGGGKRG